VYYKIHHHRAVSLIQRFSPTNFRRVVDVMPIRRIWTMIIILLMLAVYTNDPPSSLFPLPQLSIYGSFFSVPPSKNTRGYHNLLDHWSPFFSLTLTAVWVQCNENCVFISGRVQKKKINYMFEKRIMGFIVTLLDAISLTWQ
jgi:hypothetical protein